MGILLYFWSGSDKDTCPNFLYSCFFLRLVEIRLKKSEWP